MTVGLPGEVDLGSVASHEAGELVMDYLDHEFARLDGVDYVLTHRLGLDFVGKLFGYLEVYVGLEECATHVLRVSATLISVILPSPLSILKLRSSLSLRFSNIFSYGFKNVSEVKGVV